MKQECIQESKDKLIVFQENRSKITIVNKNEAKISRVKVDGCAITTGVRCDYLLLSNNIEYFIELKGQDISHAVKQLGASIDILSKSTDTKVSFIICRRGPMNSPKIQVLRAKFKKKYRFDLIIKSSPFKYTLGKQ